MLWRDKCGNWVIKDRAIIVDGGDNDCEREYGHI